MIAPGLTISGGRISVTAGAATAPALINQGYGFMANGSLAIDTDAAAGANYGAGFRLSAAGAIYGTTSTAGTDTVNQGLLMSITGQVIYESAAATLVVNGNPITANGRLAVI